ncbi:MAG: ribonuclease III [Syntrophomonadaceae bacterium]|nr:ribonuclease III [Syntrophomonadaceae bacterium]
MANNELRTAREFVEANQIKCNDLNLIVLALAHPSYAQEKNQINTNQRLEFLGDAVLNLVVAEYIFKKYPEKAEGELTKIRSRVVCESALDNWAHEMQIGKYLLLGKGEDKSGGRVRKSILADAVEAVIGAIYLDQGFQGAADFIKSYLTEAIEDAASGEFYDYKSRLQELVQAKNKSNVFYEILNENGPAHDKVFTAGVYYQDKLLATGIGRSKKEAQQKAAGKVVNDPHLLKLIDMER